MKKIITRLCLLLSVLTVIFWMIYMINQSSLIQTIAITLMTCAYHFDMRLLVGYSVDFFMHNRADYTKKKYQVSHFERQFYKMIQVKKWKDYMPTYSPEHFDLKKYSLEDVIQAMCQSEIVHRIIVILSYIPLIFIIFFDSAFVFIFTSILASLFDLSFVFIQRYNRDRIIKILNKRSRNG